MTSLALRYDNIDSVSQSDILAASPQFVSEIEYDRSLALTGRWKRELERALIEQIQPNMDEVDHLSAEHAFRFLRLLPDEMPVPTIEIESDGEIAFDWYFGKRAAFSVSIGADATLRYGGLFGFRKRSGSDQLSTFIPRDILALIAAVENPRLA